jgi:hypothetical protein
VLRAVRAEPNASGPAHTRGLSRPALGAWLAFAVVIAAAFAVHAGSAGRPERVIDATLGRARVRIDGDRGELVVEHLPSLPPGRIYELWLQAPGGRAPAPSTLFAVTSRGGADLGLPGGVHDLARVLVTAEPVGGSRRPTDRPVIVAPVT